MNNRKIASIFRDIADILEIKDENIFRIRAYRTAASRVEGLSRELSEMYAEAPGLISSIPGIGRDLADKIAEMVTTGHLEFYSRLAGEFPPGFLELLSISGLGPKKLKKLSSALGVKNIDDLEKACRAGHVRGIEGFGEKTENKMLSEIARVRRNEGRLTADKAGELADQMISYISEGRNVKKAQKAGSLRRGTETVGDIDILAVAKDPRLAAERFVSFPGVEEVIARGETKCSVKVSGACQADLRLVDEGAYGAALVYFTGSKQHNIKLRNIAKKKKYKLNEYGVFSVTRSGREKFLAGRTEEEVYAKLGLEWIPPEMREDRGEIELAAENALPDDIVDIGDIKGDLHLHTVDTDGKMTIEELIERAVDKGYKYMAVTNHSKLVRIANGMDEKRLLEHVERIRKKAARYPKIKVLAGVEVDILKDGTLDLEPYALKELDIVVAAVHSNFSADRETQTSRLLRVIDNKFVNILAHPSGRLITRREALDFDADLVFKRAAENGVILEINTHGERVDLNDVNAMRAREMGALFAINTDSHEPGQMEMMKLGVATARRAWLRRKDVVNTYPFGKLKKLLESRK